MYGDIHFVKEGALDKQVRYYSSALFKRGYMRLGFMPAHPSFYCKKACYEKYGYFDTLPTSGEIQSVASDKISHSRVC